MTVRPMTVADQEAVLTIQRSSPGAAQWPGNEWRVFCRKEDAGEDRIVRAGSCAWVATESAGVVAFLAGLFTGEILEILNLGVAPAARRKGVGSALVSHALAAARTAGAQWAYLEVRESNKSAIAFYERQGFSFLAFRKDYYRDPIENAQVLGRKL